MTVREKILIDLNSIEDPSLLNQIFEFLQILTKRPSAPIKSNKAQVLSFAGSIDKEEAEEIKKSIEEEFNQIEGDW